MIITLTGSNEFLLKQTLDAQTHDFVSKFGMHGVEQANGEELEPARLAELLQGASLFAAERLVILRDAAKNKPLWEALADWLQRVPAETTLVVVEPNLDKRTKTYKQLKKLGELHEFTELSESELANWLQKTAKELGTGLDVANANYLVSQIGTDQWRLWHELHKLANYQPHKIDKKAIDELVEPSPQASAFELLDAALGRRPDVARQQLHRLVDTEDPYRFFGLLVSQVWALATVKSASKKSAEVIAREAGIHPYVVRKTQALARNISDTELRTIINSVALCDDQLKSSGIDPWTLITQCLGKLAAR